MEIWSQRGNVLSQTVGKAFYGHYAGLKPAQREAVEPILRGEDVLVLSRTGSGKTEAAIAPLVDRYGLAARQASGCTLIHITPTRALANDLLRRLQRPMDELGFTAGIRHGERNDLTGSRSPSLLITTPESLDVMLSYGEPALMDLQAIVLDEIHLTYNTQRGFQLAVLLKRLEQTIGRRLQAVGLSATVASPMDIWQFFRPGRPITPIREETKKTIDHYICEAGTPGQLATLLDRLAKGRKTKALLFANSRRECDNLATGLAGQTAFKDQVFVHHSSLSKDTRIKVERSFQEAPHALCIATSTLELGIDIGDIDIVALYGNPGGWESFLQRIGRGNRRSDKTNVICMVSPQHGSPFLGFLGFESLISQVTGGRIEQERPMNVFGAAAQQILSVLLAGGGSYQRLADLADLFSGWPHLSRTVVERILSDLASQDYVRAHGSLNRYGAGAGLHRLHDLLLIWGNFPSRSRDVRLSLSGRELGTIPATNLLRLVPGTIVRFAGRHWRVRRTRSDVIEVEPSREASGIEVSYSGAKAPWDPGNVEEMLRLLDAGPPGQAIAAGSRVWFLDTARAVQPYAKWNHIPFACDAHGYHYFTFAGQVMNGAAARWLGVRSFEAGEVELVTDRQVDFSELPQDIAELELFACQSMQLPDSLTVFQALLAPELLNREFAEIWHKTPVFRRSLSRLRAARIVLVSMNDFKVLRG